MDPETFAQLLVRVTKAMPAIVTEIEGGNYKHLPDVQEWAEMQPEFRAAPRRAKR